VRAEPGVASAADAAAGESVAPAPWAILQHVEHEGPGLLAEALRSAGHPFDVVRLDLDGTLPTADSIGGLVVLGGPMGVHDGDAHPWPRRRAQGSPCSACASGPSSWPPLSGRR
jgi:hypothetical protein